MFQIISIKDDNISDIVCKVLKVDVDKIVNDVKKRQIPRFRDDPPGQSTISAVEELKKFYNDLNSQNQMKPEVISWIKDFRIQDLELVEQLHRLNELRNGIGSLSSITDAGEQFRAEFERLHRYQQLKEELANAEFLTSEASLEKLPDYHMRVKVW